MALDFPGNPVDGEVFGSYIWSASKGVWQSREESAAPAVVSPIPPTTPNPGDIWVDSSDGVSYVRYDDGSSGQWIEMISSGVPQLNTKANLAGGNSFTGIQTFETPIAVSSGGTGANSLTVAQANLQIPISQNYIINGAFDIWQRGISLSAAGGAYVIDQWRQYTDTGSGTNSRQSSFMPSVGQYCHRFTSSAASTNYSIFQYVETSNAINLAGKTVTLSAYLRASASINMKLEVSYSTTVDAGWGVGTFTLAGTRTVAVTTTGARYSTTVTIPSNAVSISVSISCPTNLTNGQWVEEAGVQLEEGITATPFRRNANSIQGELAACQRYYQRYNVTGSYGTVAIGTAVSATQSFFTLPLYVPMRTLIPVIGYSSLSHWGSHRPGLTITTATSLTINPGDTSDRAVGLQMQYASNASYGSYQSVLLSAVNIATAWMDFSSEL